MSLPDHILTAALEDYLETVYELVRDQKVARVRDIARARRVRAASVTPAMHRLADLGLIRYVQREYIDLTPQGEEEARRIFSRHQVLTRFLEQVLRMPADVARADACAMEHSLSREGMDYLARFFEFLRNCPDGRRFLQLFHSCSLVHDEASICQGSCLLPQSELVTHEQEAVSIKRLPPGAQGRVMQINGGGEVRDCLLDMGLLPDVLVEVMQANGAEGKTLVRVQGFEIQLDAVQAEAVLVARTRDSR